MNTFAATTLLLPPLKPRNGYLRIGILLSLCAHAALLAIHFSPSSPATTTSSSTLEVTLVNARTEEAPIAPQVLAQNQINGGGEAPAGVASSPLPHTAAESADQIILAALQKRQQELETEQQQLYTQLESRQKALMARKTPDTSQETAEGGHDEQSQESLILNAQISALKDRIERYNAQPRQHFSGPSATAVDYAEYVEAWRAKIELLGTEHYPEEARGKLYDKLQLTVYIKQNGDLDHIEINQPSKYPVLNLAAARIVQLAAPFAPLPAAMAKNTDILAITRTWHFIDNRLSTDIP